jgi:hypothetical protein
VAGAAIELACEQPATASIAITTTHTSRLIRPSSAGSESESRIQHG